MNETMSEQGHKRFVQCTLGTQTLQCCLSLGPYFSVCIILRHDSFHLLASSQATSPLPSAPPPASVCLGNAN